MCFQNILMKKLHVLHLAKIGVELDELTTEQADYLGIPKNGPFKAGTLQVLR